MLRRIPTTTDGKVIDKLQESNRINKPFKPPASSVIVDRVQPQRKRKRVSYKEAGGDDDSDGDDPRKKKKKKGDKDAAYTEGEPVNNVQNYPVFKPKPFGEVRRFSIPGMKNKDGEEIKTLATNVSLGIRPMANIIPRPLHDPMEDHAIVLYDPTIDDRETDEERIERLKEEVKEAAAKEARDKTAGMYNPHKRLKDLLGEGKEKQKNSKVPVVIDPRLTKVLRPHQVEGVQVSRVRSLTSRF
jgi:DNA repair and recombination RAD54-like protein